MNKNGNPEIQLFTGFCSSFCRYYPDILQGLYRLFANSEPDLAVRDKAAGAIARMIMVQPESIPLNQVCTMLHTIMFEQLQISDFEVPI